ncbi:MAG TPA: hypothetical protein VMV81_11780, partial [Phycisphaerae bacterium]|nr:hypothetical protein [Phycisphaerae bacterium]
MSSSLLRGMMRHRIAVSSLVHTILFAFAFFCAFGLHYNFKQFNLWLTSFFLPLLPIVVVIKVIVYAWMKMFRGSWRYVGMRDLLSVVKATHISTVIFLFVFWSIEFGHYFAFGTSFLDQFQPNRSPNPFPQAIFLLDWGMTIASICGARILVRLYYEELRPVSPTGTRSCLIVGAGDTGEALLREILRMPVARYRVAGFLDDDANKLGSQIHGIPVLGRTDEAASICQRDNVDELLIAMPKASQKKLRQMVEQLQGSNVRFRTIPAMEAVIEGRVKVSQIRDVDIKDLLGREQVELDTAR